ncbi:hypothetical protein KX729_18270 [Rhizobium sp. XQZ8]|uniref:hypothetical protein n=1 Tax=Rhizobium populisoli TaxID=2859785 RepID=UPI001CA53519|nr:hypothetical protein [Rhizobium populisoli]MBW6423406.1 hypothetical protein [Rhizobium populisoli]
MLAEFGIEAEHYEEIGSESYRFESADGRAKLLVTWSRWERFFSATYMLNQQEIFYIDRSDVVSITIVSERGAQILKVSFEAGRQLPDLQLYVEPVVRLRW